MSMSEDAIRAELSRPETEGLSAELSGKLLVVTHDRLGIAWELRLPFNPNSTGAPRIAADTLSQHHKAMLREGGLADEYAKHYSPPNWLHVISSSVFGNGNGNGNGNGQPAASVREFQWLEDIEDRPLLPPARIPYLAWPGLVTCVSGFGKVGKSELFSQALSARNTGETFLGGSFADAERPIGVACEMSAFQAARYVRQHGIRSGKASKIAFLQYPTEAERLTFIERENPGVFFVDTLTQLAATEDRDLNDAIAMRKFVTSLRQASPDLAVVLIHHTGKDFTIRNSTEIVNAVDVIVEIDRVVKGSTDDEWLPTADRTVTTRRMQLVGRGVYDTVIVDFDRQSKSYRKRDSREAINAATDATLADAMVDYIRNNPGCSRRKVYKGVKGKAEAIKVATLQGLIDNGRIRENPKQRTLFAL